jgi:hypothetical protein
MLKKEVIESLLSKTAADHLDAAFFEVGNMKYSRRDMIDILKCGNFTAAKKLQKILVKLEVVTPFKLFNTDPFSLLRVKGIGEWTVFVAMCILDAEGYDVEVWWGWKDTNTLKFNAFKQQAVKTARKRQHDVAS